MSRLLLIAALAAGGCLASPPPGKLVETDGAPGDGASEPPSCAGLDLLVESFDEPAAANVFGSLWDPGTADVEVAGGVLTLTASNGESLINSRAAFDPAGAVRYQAISLAAGGTAHFTLYDDAFGSSRITITDDQVDLYSPPDNYVARPRDTANRYYRIGLTGDQIEFAASQDGDTWNLLQAWQQGYVNPVRVAVAVANSSGTAELVIQGVNTPETGLDCP